MCSSRFELCAILCSKAILLRWLAASSRLSLVVSPLGDSNRIEQLFSTVQKLLQSSLISELPIAIIAAFERIYVVVSDAADREVSDAGPIEIVIAATAHQ